MEASTDRLIMWYGEAMFKQRLLEEALLEATHTIAELEEAVVQPDDSTETDSHD